MKMYLGLSILLISCTGLISGNPGYDYRPAVRAPQVAYQQQNPAVLTPQPQAVQSTIQVAAPQVAYQHQPAAHHHSASLTQQVQAIFQAQPQVAYQQQSAPIPAQPQQVVETSFQTQPHVVQGAQTTFQGQATYHANQQAPQTSFQTQPQVAYHQQPAQALQGAQTIFQGQAAYHANQQAPILVQAPQQLLPTLALAPPTVPVSHVHTIPTQQTHRLAPIVTKSIYLHAAPNDFEDDSDFQRQLSEIPVRKNYRIVFIKAPTPSNKHLIQSIKKAQALNEEKTVIYVLSKKHDAGELQRQLAEVQHKSTQSKPEVFFIKYKTAEEAVHAQHQIQAQYDVLGGSTQISDEGFAPISSVVGSLARDSASVQALASNEHSASVPFVGIPTVQNGAYGPVVVAGNVASASAGNVAAPSNLYLPQ